MPKVVRRSTRLKAKVAGKAVTEPVEVPQAPVVAPSVVTVPTETAFVEVNPPQSANTTVAVPPVTVTVETPNSPAATEAASPQPTSTQTPAPAETVSPASAEPEAEAEMETDDDDNYYTFQISKKTFWVFIVMVLVGVLLTSGFLLWQRAEHGVVVKPSPSSAVTAVVVSPSPTPEASPDMSVLKVQVLNGSGTAGVAATVKDLFKEYGFAQIDTGNAGSSDFTKTEISAKKEVPAAVLTQITAALEKENYTVTTEELASSSKFDIVITVGQKGE